MKKCRECLVDVERALSHGYPRDKSFKLLLREMQCHRDLENNEEMDASFEKAADLLQSLPGTKNSPATIMDYTMKDPEVETEKDKITAKIFPDNNNFFYQLQRSALIKEFSEAPTNEARMKVTANFFSLLGEDNYIEQCFREVKDKTNFKDKEKSEQFRTQGNTEYRKGDDRKALELYTKSIAYAPQDSSELSLAYANRSAVLRSMKKCRECLVDVERALSHGYPRDKSFKLLLRVMQCHRDLENNEEMDASFEKAANLLQSLPGLAEKERAALQQHLEEEKKAPPKEVCTEQVIFPEQVPELSYGASSEVVGASSAVRIEYNEQQGDVLLIGENIVRALIDKHKYDHCAHCYKPCYNLIPCHNCVWVLFCSKKCQSKANKKYHLAECIIYSRFCHINGKLFAGDVNDRVIRLLAMIGINNLQPYLKYSRIDTKRAWKSMNNEAKRTKGYNSHKVFDSTNFDTIFNLVSLIDEQNQNDLMNLSLFSLQIPRCFGMSMKDRNFFAVAGLCLQLQDTAFLTNITQSYLTFKSVPIVIAGHCFNPLFSLVNHSCIGNVASIKYGNKVVSVAFWPIPKGSILTDNYAHMNMTRPKEQRQQILKTHFLFDCTCDACENDWRLMDKRLSDPVDQKLATDFLEIGESIIFRCHLLLSENQLSPMFEKLLEHKHNFLTKLWNKSNNGGSRDAHCQIVQLIQKQLVVYHRLQGNRVYPNKKEQESTRSALIKEFSEAPTNEARMKVTANFFSLLGKDNYIEQCFREVKDKTNFKDKEKSEQFRTQGNTEYRKGDDKKALELYTKSIAYAPQDSSELSLAYANRSAVLRSMKKCRECLVDVERALSHGYPRDKSFKLLLRVMQCHRDLENNEEMDASFEKAANLLQSLPGLAEKERAALQQHLEEEKKAPPKEVCTEQVIFPEQVPELSYGASSEVVGASSAVRIEYNEQQGDVLLIGENIVRALIDKHKYDHCAHCYKPCYNLIPCHNCVWVLFCSKKCQSKANKKYHLAECIIYSRFCHINGKLFAGDVNDRVIRLLAMIGINNLQPYLKYSRIDTKRAWKSMNNEAKRTKGYNSHKVFDSTNFDTIFNLVSLIDEQNQNDLMNLSLFSLQIPRCFGMSMKDRNFFAVAGLCLQLQDTAFLTNITQSYLTFKSVPIVIAGHCFNPLFSLVNHSCIGNVASIKYGNKVVSVAFWPIPKGSILTDNYAHMNMTRPKEQRQQILKTHFLFDCTCDACENDWRLMDKRLSDPVDQKLATDFLEIGESIIFRCHLLLSENQLSPMFEKLLEHKHNFLTKLWNKSNNDGSRDAHCQIVQLIQKQL
ncbi:hypothetical protein B566_EDAN011068, partial [Ephemera danica]